MIGGGSFLVGVTAFLYVLLTVIIINLKRFKVNS
nr:MAG TPA: hypothetical protein [Bacteriophage sp.]